MGQLATPFPPVRNLWSMKQTSPTLKEFTHSDYDEPFLDVGNERQWKIQPHTSEAKVWTPALLSFWKTLFLPIMGVAYLVFCYFCHNHIVEVGRSTGPLSQLPIIKAGVTSLSIVFVTISFLPLSNLISDLKSEEFFRALANKKQGVPLSSLNNVSTPSRGIWDTLQTLYHRQGSKYSAGTFVIALVLLVASAFIPAAISVDTVLFDGDLVALSIGAITPNSLLMIGNFSSPSVSDLPSSLIEKSSQVGSLVWAETALDVNYSFRSQIVNETTYAVPAPVDLSTNTTASWLSDVVAMHPVCEWIAPNIISRDTNLSDFTSPDLIMNLESKGVQVQMPAGQLSFTDNYFFTTLKSNLSGFGSLSQMRRFDTHDDPTDGSSLWMFAQCSAGCMSDDFLDPFSIAFAPDYTSSQYKDQDGQGRNISFLFCTPRAEIQTRHIRNNGTGALTVGKEVPVRQGNLYAAQTKLAMSYVFEGFDTAGPKTPTNIAGIGNQAQFILLFGKNFPTNATNLAMSPIQTITEYYGRYLQSGMKKFLDGSLASSYVPSRPTHQVAVLSPSIPHVILSTVLYTILTIFVVVCHFRKPSPRFTLSDVAASLENSNIPRLFDEFRPSKLGEHAEVHAIESFGGARVISETGKDGSHVLKLRTNILGKDGDREMT